MVWRRVHTGQSRIERRVRHAAALAQSFGISSVELHRREMRHQTIRGQQQARENLFLKEQFKERTRFDNMIAEFPSWLKPETGVIKAIVSLD